MDEKKELYEQTEINEEYLEFSLNNYLDETRPLPEYCDRKPGRFLKKDDVDIVANGGVDIYKLIFTKEKPNYNFFLKAIKNF